MASSRCGYSKAQMCFFKILHIISSIPPSKEEQPFPTNNTKGVGIDLNLRFCSVSESGESESSGSDANDQGNNNNSNNNNNNNNKNNEGLREKSLEVSEKSLEVSEKSLEVSEKVHDNEVNNVESESEDGNAETASFRGNSDNNCLDLLIEAARVLKGKDESESEEERGLGGELETPRASQEKRKERWVVVDLYGDVVEEREPVVRSKRGRNQALPYRFRDSVVEPLKRSNRSSHRPSSTAHLSKRLLRSSSTT